jgi:hypothetical protein
MQAASPHRGRSVYQRALPPVRLPAVRQDQRPQGRDHSLKTGWFVHHYPSPVQAASAIFVISATIGLLPALAITDDHLHQVPPERSAVQADPRRDRGLKAGTCERLPRVCGGVLTPANAVYTARLNDRPVLSMENRANATVRTARPCGRAPGGGKLTSWAPSWT